MLSKYKDFENNQNEKTSNRFDPNELFARILPSREFFKDYEDIPEHETFGLYSPDYSIWINPGNKRDENEIIQSGQNVKYIDKLMETVLVNIRKI